MKFTVKAAPFGAALHNVLPHANTDDLLPVLKTVRLTLDEDGRLTVDATDRYSLGEQVIPADPDTFTASRGGNVLLPLELAKDIAKAAKALKLPGDISVTVEGSQILVEHPGGSLTGRAADGEFPKVETLWAGTEGATGDGATRLGLATWQVLKFAKLLENDMRPVKRPTLDMRIVSANKPSVVRISGLDNFRALLMPVRLSDEAAA